MPPSTSHRSGLAPALGLRAGSNGFLILPQTASERRVSTMRFPFSLRKRRARGPSLPRRAKPRRPAAHKLCLEPLEDRCLLDASFGDWGNVTNLGNIVNTPYLDQRGTISKDGLSLYFG